MAEQRDPGAGDGPDQDGGDPACWSHLVCPTCGRMLGDAASVCDACGATLLDD